MGGEKETESMNLLTAGIILSTVGSVFFYWASAKNQWMKQAYYTAIANGLLLTWTNWVLSAPGRVPEITLQGIEWTTNTQGTNIFTALCVMIIISGIRGLMRLREEKRGTG